MRWSRPSPLLRGSSWRRARRSAVATFALAGPLLLGSAATCAPAAADAGAAGTPIGGPLLGAPGVVVQPAAGAPALPEKITAKTWLVADLTTGDVLAAKGAHVPHLPASTLKTLTAATLIPRLDPASTFRTTNRDASVDGTRVGLVPGMRYTVNKLFQAM